MFDWAMFTITLKWWVYICVGVWCIVALKQRGWIVVKTLQDLEEKRINWSIGYKPDCPVSNYLTIRYEGNIYRAECPACKSGTLKWGNWGMVKIDDEIPLYGKCCECGEETLENDIKIGEVLV